MKQYKPLLSSAPANSILNAQQFHYTNSASTDIRKTFANFRRNASRATPAERRDERSDIDEESDRRDASALFACAAATILGLIDSIQHYAKENEHADSIHSTVGALDVRMPARSSHRQRGDGRSPRPRRRGQVEAIEIYRAPDNKLVNGGTLIGGIAGGVIGHQIGSGRGNTAATIAGALGGAVVGNEIEKKQGQATRYRITVRLDSGSWLIVEDSATSTCGWATVCGSRTAASIGSSTGSCR